MASASNWLRKNIVSRYVMKGCPEEEKCLEILEIILDEETTQQEKEEYFAHIERCWTCFQNHNLEKNIKELIKSKIDNKPIPKDLILKIQAVIEKSTTS